MHQASCPMHTLPPPLQRRRRERRGAGRAQRGGGRASAPCTKESKPAERVGTGDDQRGWVAECPCKLWVPRCWPAPLFNASITSKEARGARESAWRPWRRVAPATPPCRPACASVYPFFTTRLFTACTFTISLSRHRRSRPAPGLLAPPTCAQKQAAKRSPGAGLTLQAWAHPLPPVCFVVRRKPRAACDRCTVLDDSTRPRGELRGAPLAACNSTPGIACFPGARPAPSALRSVSPAGRGQVTCAGLLQGPCARGRAAPVAAD